MDTLVTLSAEKCLEEGIVSSIPYYNALIEAIRKRRFVKTFVGNVLRLDSYHKLSRWVSTCANDLGRMVKVWKCAETETPYINGYSIACISNCIVIKNEKNGKYFALCGGTHKHAEIDSEMKKYHKDNGWKRSWEPTNDAIKYYKPIPRNTTNEFLKACLRIQDALYDIIR